MTSTASLKQQLMEGALRSRLLDLYIDENKLSYETARYENAISRFEETFGPADVEIYSAPGRTEIGGNHTDHQHGAVLAASINDDVIAVVSKRKDGMINLLSEGYPLISISSSDTAKYPEEEGSTIALLRGVLHGFESRGYRIDGFDAYATSDVLSGSGLSSSAAFETLLGAILSGLYNDGMIAPTTLAIIGQYAENVYFGKPSGLMDQTASAVGGLCRIDFFDPTQPEVTPIAFDLESHGYTLCITDTKGSHADLTPDYAAVPAEMKAVAAYFGKEVLREVEEAYVLHAIPALREAAGDRAVLRALHFFEENRRVFLESDALLTDDFDAFLHLVAASGSSSFRFLQNVYPPEDITRQEVSLALAVSEIILKQDGVARVHGGGFAGTIQAFVKNETVPAYQAAMDHLFGEGACHLLKIRKYGGIRVF